ncbi:uncharacterized protein MYCFIDRAFT_173471 [Pseudocercospora fijiensis CIRAD86]|uniref:Uncharacterized protein n=1 Tax=Pseudocercospora fijiensis (strain CIRAD86) TaxID=383855 RepID=M3AIR9_PSEFD|nr:uncharacterized protein MYCFIDRAFT_173471 [Pseudocercospora fijiensis CIRAD86]EME84491.1 hypothetical protein MYCFIDRAFT_173471 [Pseudocercospora fijiensis CIRAD86]
MYASLRSLPMHTKTISGCDRRISRDFLLFGKQTLEGSGLRRYRASRCRAETSILPWPRPSQHCTGNVCDNSCSYEQEADAGRLGAGSCFSAAAKPKVEGLARIYLTFTSQHFPLSALIA